MRRMILPFVLGLMVMGFLGFRASNYEPKPASAEVDMLQGLLVFVDSKPVMEYEYLGTVKSAISLGDSQYTGVRNRLIKKVKNEYPDANGIILYFNTGGADRADAIKFKK